MELGLAPALPEGLLEELRKVIDQTRQFIAMTVNSTLTTAFWKVGNRIRKETLQEGRADYGREIVVTHDNWLLIMVTALQTKTYVE